MNLASRLEGQSSLYGVAMLVGAAAVAKSEGKLAFLEVDMVQVKGKAEPERALTATWTYGQDLGLEEFFQLYEARLSDFRANPPPPQWDGVYVATTK